MKSNGKISNELKFKGNPRKISDEKKELLKKHIEELGDLSGVVYCRTHEAYVSGNQRSDILNDCLIEFTEEYDEPNKQRTIAYGFINYDGERFAYREVEYSEEQFKRAVVIANNGGGENDWEILSNDEWADVINEVGMNIPISEEQAELDAEQKAEIGEVKFSEFLNESNNYLVLFFDNEIDWLQAQTHFNLETVSSKRSNGKPWSKGVGRVLNGANYLDKIKN